MVVGCFGGEIGVVVAFSGLVDAVAAFFSPVGTWFCFSSLSPTLEGGLLLPVLLSSAAGTDEAVVELVVLVAPVVLVPIAGILSLGSLVDTTWTLLGVPILFEPVGAAVLPVVLEILTSELGFTLAGVVVLLSEAALAVGVEELTAIELVEVVAAPPLLGVGLGESNEGTGGDLPGAADVLLLLTVVLVALVVPPVKVVEALT